MNENIFLYPCSNRKEMGVYWLRYFSNISLYHSHNPSSSCYSCRQCYCYRCCCHFLCRYCYGYQYRLCCFIKGSKTPGKKQIFLQNETFQSTLCHKHTCGWLFSNSNISIPGRYRRRKTWNTRRCRMNTFNWLSKL